MISNQETCIVLIRSQDLKFIGVYLRLSAVDRLERIMQCQSSQHKTPNICVNLVD